MKLTTNIDLNMENGHTALKSLLRCIEENNSKRLEKLLNRKTSLHLGRSDLSKCLCEAIIQGKHGCAPLFLAAGADPNFVTDDGKTPLHLLLEQSGHPPTIKAILQAGGNANKPSTSLQQVPLHVAARKGHQVCIHVLISGGARIDRPDSNGSTPLMYAAQRGHLTTVGMLLREGADPNFLNLQSESALHFASTNGHADCVQELLSAGADANCRDDFGQTPLFLACKAGHLEVVEVLLDFSCDVNAQNTRSGKTVLHWAVQNADLNLVQVLLKRGAEPNVRDNDWETPFMTALNIGRIDIIDLLIKAGSRISVTDRSFNTALHVAARDGHSNIIPVLVEGGLDINLKGAGGLTPLMLASLGGHTQVVSMLLEQGANPDVVDRNCASALICAIISNASEQNVISILKMLIRANCLLDNCANALNLMKSLNLKMDRKFRLEDRLYSALELAFMKGRIVAFMLLLQAGCELRHLDLDKLLATSATEHLKGVDLKSCQYMLKCFNREKYDIKPLKEMCRRQALTALGGKVSSHVIGKLPVSDQIKRFLAYEDLDHLEQSFNLAFRDRRIKSELPKLAPINENVSSTPFSRQDKRRQTYHIGSRRITSPTPNSAPQTPKFRKPSGTASPSVRSPSTSATPSPVPSPSPFKRSASLRLPRNTQMRRTTSNGSVSSESPSPSSPTPLNQSKPKSSPACNIPKSPKAMKLSDEILRKEYFNKKRFGSPDTGYSSTCSSCADWTSANGAISIPQRDQDSDSSSTELLSPGGLSKWSTQDDVNLSDAEGVKPVRSRTSSESSNTPKSKIPVLQPKSPKPVRSSKDDISNSSRIPITNASNFTRSRSFRKY